ncbi:hypothetical protein [Eleftheria terrae]|uniref:hypothetical protein n=1 Tax=Eleftheria terrae TaxID=1597781 RepID=UPI00263B4241|nr:hypothetical protein [Eleftheria terrae]WKB52319.1 hypothetical protein N7L95_21385 [Eleftheria terrae]
MALLPTEASLTGASTTNDQQKLNFARLRQYLADLLGTDSSDRAAARAALGAFSASGGTIAGATTVQGDLTAQGAVKASGLIYARGGGQGLGQVTVSTAPPSGAAADGDLWLQY